MRIAELAAFAVELPLRRVIAHASATRTSSTNLFIRCRLSDGTIGWGEGVPRSYVTGETVDGAFQQLSATPLREQLTSDCHSWADVIALSQRFAPPVENNPRGCSGNALRCAIELSLLDAYGRLFGQSISELLRHLAAARAIVQPASPVRYSATITAESPRSEAISAVKMRVYGFEHVKVKVGVQGADDAARLRRIRRYLGSRIDLRLDANEAWAADEVIARVQALLPYRISCIEQPVPHREVDRLGEIRKELPVPVMLDESLTSMADADAAIERGTCDLFNIRLSKCGGFVSSVLLAARAHEAGLGYQLGCHPGESPILSAAGRHFASCIRGIRYREGSYDRHLLKVRFSKEDITFGYGGRAPVLRGPGLDITVDGKTVERLATRQQTFRVASS